MGTSTSCKGGGPRSPFDPEWLVPEGGLEQGPGPDDEPVRDGDAEPGGDVDDGHGLADAEQEQAVPNRRFAAARTSMSSFLGGGGGAALNGAVKGMVKRGMGGSRRAAATMRATAVGAGQLGQFLAAARDGTDPEVVDWVRRVREAGLSANDLVLELVKEVMPNSGTIDEETLRNSAAEALGQLYEADADVDIFHLTDGQIARTIGFVVANDLCSRIDLMLGQTYERLKFSPAQVQLYLKEVKEFVHGKVQVFIDGLGGRRLDPHALARDVLASTLKVFAEE